MNTSATNIVYPFDIIFAVAAPLHSAKLDIVIKTIHSFQQSDRIKAIVELWISAANLGMFSGEHIEPSHSVITTLGVKVNSANVLHYELECAGVSVGAYQVLLKMLFQSHHHKECILHIAVRMANISGTLLNLEQVLCSRLPGRYEPLPFTLSIPQPLEDNTYPVIRLQFCKELSDNEFEYISRCITIWDKLVASGGYYEPFEPIEAPQDEDELYLVSPDTVEHPCEGSQDEPMAYDALINMAVRLHVTFCPLVALEID